MSYNKRQDNKQLDTFKNRSHLLNFDFWMHHANKTLKQPVWQSESVCSGQLLSFVDLKGVSLWLLDIDFATGVVFRCSAKPIQNNESIVSSFSFVCCPLVKAIPNG
jgi:hypothetical protein